MGVRGLICVTDLSSQQFNLKKIYSSVYIIKTFNCISLKNGSVLSSNGFVSLCNDVSQHVSVVNLKYLTSNDINHIYFVHPKRNHHKFDEFDMASTNQGTLSFKA